MSKIVENWKDVPHALSQQMDWHNSFYGYIGMQDHTRDPIIRPGSFVQIDSRQRAVSPVNWHTSMTVRSFSSNSTTAMFVVGANCMAVN
ncbi:MAG: hypothetical protein WBV55_05020 [Candidatus Sulfotelmatobacter sp.]